MSDSKNFWARLFEFHNRHTSFVESPSQMAELASRLKRKSGMESKTVFSFAFAFVFNVFLAFAPNLVVASENEIALSVSFDELDGHQAHSQFVFAVIRPAADVASPPSRETQALARRLLLNAHNWSLDQIRDRYTHHPAEKFETMRRAGVKLTPHSAFIIAYRKGDYTQPVGTLWTAYPDASGRIDLERSLGWTYPKKDTHNGVYPTFQSTSDTVPSVTTKIERQGGVVELKRLVMNPQAPRGLMPAMLLRGESYDHLNTQPISYETTPDGITQPVYPGEYALRCDRKLIPIYQRFGFRLANPEPLSGDYVMSLDRLTYVAFATKWIEKAHESGWRIRFDAGQARHSKELESTIRAAVTVKTCRDTFATVRESAEAGVVHTP